MASKYIDEKGCHNKKKQKKKTDWNMRNVQKNL